MRPLELLGAEGSSGGIRLPDHLLSPSEEVAYDVGCGDAAYSLAAIEDASHRQLGLIGRLDLTPALTFTLHGDLPLDSALTNLTLQEALGLLVHVIPICLIGWIDGSG